MFVREALGSAPMVNDLPGLRLLQVGECWDLVRTPARIGLLALAHLRATGARIGPVLYDKPNERLYYAIMYAARFYASVANGHSVQAAHDLGRAAIELAGLPDHELPTLACALDVDPKATFLVKPPQ